VAAERAKTGLLSRALLGGSKVRWTGGASALLWIPVLLFGFGLVVRPASGAPNPFLSNATVGVLLIGGATVGFLLSWLLLWLACYLVDCVRHRDDKPTPA
jgi:polyferredoxin